MVNQVKIVQKCAVVSGGEILVIQRSITDNSRPGCWDFPGGNVDQEDTTKFKGDILKQAMAREVKEEIGFKVSDSEIKAINITSGYDKRGFLVIWIGYVFSLETKPEIVLSEEHIDHKWVSLDEFINLDFGFAKDDFMGMVEGIGNSS